MCKSVSIIATTPCTSSELGVTLGDSAITQFIVHQAHCFAEIRGGTSALGSMVSSFFEGAICSALSSSTSDLKHNSERKFPIYEFLPMKVQEHMSARNTTLFYRINSIESDEHQLTVRAQIEWQKLIPATSDDASRLLNGQDERHNSTKLMDMEMKNGD
ncbi:unnamed protein product [Caenorhabditis sp. 36 PRJEB53466]|nr:unnamed protein product [Caenorhabditis sp. 36 PRJEB53466]